MIPSTSLKWPRVLAWSAVVLAGTGSLAVLAWSRREPVNALWMVVAALCVFAVSYRFHSAWLMAKVLTLDELRATPALVHEDGRDFVKTNRWVVFGHHFAAIAGPGPLVGPVLAAQFGYLPGLLWILVGATLGGAVHDSIILFCSTRRRGKSLGQMISEEINPFVGVIALISIVAILIILIAVLALVVVNALAESPWGLFTIAATMPIAIVMGVAMRTAGHGTRALLWISVGGVLALLGAVYVGQFIHQSPAWSALFKLKGATLAWWMIGYGFLASTLPVWLLLAPRDYLSTFMKIGTVLLLAVAVVAIAPMLKMPSLTRFIDGTGPVLAGPVFPFCFITIACAAVSGFHSLISSGTTPKMITRESDIRIIGYGAMITEMLVGVMALVAACAMEPGEYFAINIKGEPAAVVAKVTALGYPVSEAQMAILAADVGEQTMIGRTGGAPTFAVGMARMFAGVLGSKAALALWYHFAIMFEAVFILTTLDAGTRVGRFMLQDALGHLWKPFGATSWYPSVLISSALVVAGWGYFLYIGVVDPNGGINILWPLFGIANQLLAGIALTVATGILIKQGKLRHCWVTAAPLAWLAIVTTTASWEKLVSTDPRVGFLAAADQLAGKLASGALSPEQAAVAPQLIFNQRLDAALALLLTAILWVVIGDMIRISLRVMRGQPVPPNSEAPYVKATAEAT